MFKPKVTDEQIIKEWEKQLTQREIGKNLGISQPTVWMRMKKIGLEPWHKQPTPLQDKILSYIKNNPSTYKEISEGTGLSYYNVGFAVRRLRRKHELNTLNMGFGAARTGIFSSYELIDGLTNLTLIYFPEDEEQLGKKIIKYLPNKVTTGMRKALTRRLKYILPEKSHEIVRKYLRAYRV